MEDEVFDAVNGNYFFLWPHEEFTTCLGEYPVDRPSYTNWLFFRYVAEHNGGTNIAGGGENIMQEFWTNVADGQTGLTAYNNALATKGANLDDTFHNYAIASRFTKSCPTASPYCFEEAAGYVTAKGANQNHGEITSVGGSYSGNLQDNYAINWIGLPTSGPYSVVLENPSIFFGGEFRVSIVADTGNALEVTPFQSVADSNSHITLGYEPPAGATSVVAVITNQSQTADNPESCNASPYKLSIPIPRPISFVIDDTGSMGPYINIVKTTVAQKVDEFVTKSIFPTYHLLTYKDVENYRGKTADPNTIKSWVNNLSASYGGDCPEEMLGALNRIAIEAPHSEAWVLTDAGFHGGPIDVVETIKNLINADIKTHFITYSSNCVDSASSTPSAEPENTAINQSNEQNITTLDSGLTVSAFPNAEPLVQIANETGGHYFAIPSSETQAVGSILLNEMVSNVDLATFSAEVVSASPKTYSVSIDSTSTEANFLLNVFSGNANLTLINPNGITVNPSDPGVTYTAVSNAKYYQIANPVVGIWQAQVSGDGIFALSSSGNSPIGFEYLSDTSLAKDEPANLLVLLTGPVASASFQFVHPDGTLLQTVDLFDDGLHGDDVADDGVYGGTYTPTTAGSFYIRVEGTTTDSTEFERIVTKMIRVQTMSVVAPAGQTVPAGTTHVYDFSIINGGTVDEIYDLAITSSQGWADLSGVPSSVTVLAGATEHILIPVNVPIMAVEGSTDELMVTAVNQLNALVHDSDSVQTTVLVPPTACTPSNSYSSSQGVFQFASYKQTSNLTNFDTLPLSFVPNIGQEDEAVKFQAQGLGGKLFFTPSEVVFSLPNPVKVKEDDKDKIRYDLHPANVVRIHYQGANENPEITGMDALPGVVNYLKGNDPSKWIANLPTYSGIAYHELYPGIELRYEGTDGNLKSAFHVASGADPSSIIWRYKGADSVSVDESGNLMITLPSLVEGESGKTLIEQAPIAWQDTAGGNRIMVTVRYAVDRQDKKVSFTLPDGYDSTLPLVIDPTISYSAYLGGGKDDEGNAITLDADCNVYLTGSTYSTDFPIANQVSTNLPSGDVFVSKLNPAGTALSYSTYLGGDQSESAWAIGLDSAGKITVSGHTKSSNFPSMNGFDTTFAGGACDGSLCDDAFVTQLSADGRAVLYSSFLGGTGDEEVNGMALGPDDKIHLTGSTSSSGFATANGYDTSFGGGTCSGEPCYDGFVVKVNPAVSGAGSLLYNTYLGGTNYEEGKSIAVDAEGMVYVAGYANSDNFPTLNPYQSTRAGSADTFVSKFDLNLSGSASLLYSTYLGGSSSDKLFSMALGETGHVYLTGETTSTNYPLANPFDTTVNGTDVFVTHLNIANNTLVYSSYLGGSGEERGLGITVDAAGNAYVTGYTESTNFLLVNAIQPTKGGDACGSPPCADAFLTKMNVAGNPVLSTYLGGSQEDYGNAIVVDGLGGVYITGYTFSIDFPTTADLSVGSNSYSDAFVVKIDE